MTKIQQWLAVGVVGCLAILAVGWFALVSPQRSHAHRIDQSVGTVDSRISDLRLQLEQQLAKQRNLPQEEVALAELQTRIPSTPNLPSMIRQLVTAASTAGVDLSTIAPSTPATVTPLAGESSTITGVVMVPLSITITGTYYNVEEFFSNVHSMSRSLLVSGFSMAPLKPNGTASPVLTVTLTARAFMTDPSATGATGTSTAPPTGATATPSPSTSTSTSAGSTGAGQ